MSVSTSAQAENKYAESEKENTSEAVSAFEPVAVRTCEFIPESLSPDSAAAIAPSPIPLTSFTQRNRAMHGDLVVLLCERNRAMH